MPPRKTLVPRLYARPSLAPSPGFNDLVFDWLADKGRIAEHKRPAEFEIVRQAYETQLGALLQGINGPVLNRWRAHRFLLSNLTKILLGVDLTGALTGRLSSTNINQSGFRSPLAQAAAKNNGENFVNVVVYALADALRHQDEVLVDKSLPPHPKDPLQLTRTFEGSISGRQDLRINIESDFTIFSRSDPHAAILVSAKTRLKEAFHIGTMYKLFFDMIGDRYCQEKWGLRSGVEMPSMDYVFVTSDGIPTTGERTQGGDIERLNGQEPRNAIKTDASFFDYVFVSKSGLPHVSQSLRYGERREMIFHELGCLMDLVEQKYAPLGFSHP